MRLSGERSLLELEEKTDDAARNRKWQEAAVNDRKRQEATGSDKKQ